MCCVPGCDEPTLVKKFDLCENHYRTMRRNGSPTAYKNKPWGSARTLRTDGYIYITVDGKQVMEHRHIMEEMLGRKLKSYEVVHHLDGNRQHNDEDNLELHTIQSHGRLHGHERTVAQMDHMRAAKHETLKKED